MSITVSESGFIAGKMLAMWEHEGKPFRRIFHFDSNGGVEVARKTLVWASANNVAVSLLPIRFSDYDSVREMLTKFIESTATAS